MENIPELTYSQRPCPICGKSERALLFPQRFAEFSAEGLLAGYDVVTCRHCGFCFGDHIPGQDAFDRYYEVMSKYEIAQRPATPMDHNQQRLLEVVPFIERAAQHNQAILEIGFASGQLPHLLRERGYGKLQGIDPSSSCAHIARECYGIPVQCGTFSSITLAEPQADLVILIGVLEHIHDLSQAMQVLRALVPDAGRVFITVPDASHYAQGIDAPFQEFSVEHINFFGPLSLANLMSANGFEQLFCESASVHANANTITPVVHGAFAKRAASTGFGLNVVSRDDGTEPALREYVDKSHREHQQVVPVLQRLADGRQPLIIWGAGAHTLRLLAQAPLAQANITSIIDSNPRYLGKRIGSVPVVGPDQRPDDDASILVSSRVYQDDICRQIRERLNWKNQVITLY